MKKKHQYLLMMVILVLVLVWGLWNAGAFTNPVAIDPTPNDEVHVHSDFALYINGDKVDFTADKYQSTTYDPKHPTFHFHDGVDTMLHRHADGVTLGEFFGSLGYELTSECITTDVGEEYCTSDEKVLRMYVNGVIQDNPAEYITAEEDRILLYYGDDDPEYIAELNDSITDEACIYSYTCPERGTPPAESCTTSCEV